MGLAGTVGETTLSTEQMPEHVHTYGVSGSGTGTENSWVPASSTSGAGSYPETSLAGGSQPHAHPLEGATDQTDSLPPFLSFEIVVRVALGRPRWVCGRDVGLAGTVGETTLSTEQMPAHGHSYTFRSASRDCGYASGSPMFWQNTTTANTGNAGGGQAHTHPLTGSIEASETLPPFHSFPVVMRCA